MIPSLHPEYLWKCRTFTAQITNVDDEKGMASVRLTTGEGYDIPISFGAMSLPLVKQGTADEYIRTPTDASWDRTMPQEGDFVKVAFGPDNRPEMIAGAMFGSRSDEDGAVGQRGAYAAQVEAHERGDFPQFVRLKAGEFDKRAAGGARIHGRRTGVLHMSAGTATLELKKRSATALVKAPTVSLSARQSTVNLERADTATTAFRVDIVTPSVTPLAQASLRLGGSNDRDNTRLVEEVFRADGTSTVYYKSVDNGGNVLVEGYYEGTYTVDGFTTITFESPEIKLGEQAASAVIKGDEFVQWLNTNFQVATALGPSGPVIGADAAKADWLSTKVKVE